MPVAILTEREIEFLASLRNSWSRLYWTEFARLVQEDAGRDEGCCIKPQSNRLDGFVPRLRLVN
jgi:hypothetical protein